MLAVGKALLVLLFDLVFCYLFGTLINNRILKKVENPLENTVMGFFAQQAVFQVLALLVYWKTAILHHLSILWIGTIAIVVLLTILFARKQVVCGLQKALSVIKQNKKIFVLGMVVVLLAAFYVATHGVSDDDAMYYIALVNTTASTDRIYQYNVYTGEIMDAMYGRRALVTFEIQSAVYAQIFHVHALLITRIFRACENVVLTAMSVYLCGSHIFHSAVDKHKKSMQLIIFYFMMQPLFVDTIFTPATFLLNRGYEGKAFTANVIALFVLYRVICALKTKNIKELFLLGVVCWGSVAVSTSAVALCGSEVIALYVVTYLGMWINEKRERQRA